MANGIRDASSYFRAKIGKGDINTGEELILTVSSTGIANKFIKRKGAEPGDYIVASDYFGLERLGLDALLGRYVGGKEMINKAKNRFLRPTIDYKKILWCINKGYAKASIDSSDGLAISLYELADLNNAKVIVENIPMYPGLDEFLNDDKQVLEYVFYGGEEYITILVIDGSRWRDFTRESDRYGFSFIKVGRMHSGSGVYLKLDHDEVLLDRRGWDPFVL
jgi:thiamine-monophosphate kinase